jgi:SAM-dependent methyltransferase
MAAAAWDGFEGKRVLDFGYGTVGQLRLMASLGADAVGTEVQPVFRALYSEPGDQGAIKGRSGSDGKVTLVHGQWPAGEGVGEAVGGGFDLFTSKNTLKRGYIHPEREADPRTLVHLGVNDEAFVRAMFDVLKPGGYAIIYNLSPAPAPPDKPYIPWADGRCPFDRALLERIGFEVIAYDVDDCPAAYDYWFALGYEDGKSREELARELFAHYTMLRRPTN